MAKFAILFGGMDFAAAGAEPPAGAIKTESETWHGAVRDVWMRHGSLNDNRCLVWREGRPAAVVLLDFQGKELVSMAETPP